MKKKVLIVLADVGNGHKSAANAITNTFIEYYNDDYELKVIDLFEASDIQPFNSSAETHILISRNKIVENIFNFIFNTLNKKIFFDIFNSYTLSRMLDECEKIVMNEKPDIVISVHPITSMILKGIKERNNSFKYAVVITDLVSIFRGWADSSADLVFCGTSEAVNTIVRFGVDVNKIHYPLFPINPSLKDFKSKDTMLKILNLDETKLTILITGGGQGTVLLKDAIKRLANHNKYQVIVICGRSESLIEDLTYEYKNNPSIKILGFVNNIQDYLNLSDLIISKPGPATILEIELFAKKSILTRYIGLQEVGNISYALRNPRFRYIGSDWNRLQSTIDEIIHTKPNEVNGSERRSFDECKQIVDRIIKE